MLYTSIPDTSSNGKENTKQEKYGKKKNTAGKSVEDSKYEVVKVLLFFSLLKMTFAAVSMLYVILLQKEAACSTIY